MALKIYDYACDSCGSKAIDQLAEHDEIIKCKKCKMPMSRLFPCPRGGEQRGNFKPFWSDTFQMRVKDREDLKTLKSLREKNGLECVGHRRQRPDRQAIRHNFETE